MFDRISFARALAADAASIGLELDTPRLDGLLGYLEQMLRWNRTYNLTAIRDPEAMRVQHLLDSMAVIPALRSQLAQQRPESTTAIDPIHIMDVGSGGGLPGVVLAIVHPEWRICCVDAVEKKTAFVRQVAGVLGLANLTALHARVEELEPVGCDLVISRAFASLDDFAALAGRHVRDGGTLAAMKGKQPDEELAVLLARGVWMLHHLQSIDVPGLDAQRCIAFLTRT